MHEIDPKLIAPALAVGEHDDSLEVIEAALREYIRKRQTQSQTQDEARGLLALFGTIEYDETFDGKAQRQKS